MRVSHGPGAVGLCVLGVVTLLAGIRLGLVAAAVVYVIGMTVYVRWAWRMIREVGYVDHAWPAPVWLGLIGWGTTVAVVYLFLYLWLLRPDDLFILRSAPFFGAALTLGWLGLIQGLGWAIVRAAFFGGGEDAGPYAGQTLLLFTAVLVAVIGLPLFLGLAA